MYFLPQVCTCTFPNISSVFQAVTCCFAFLHNHCSICKVFPSSAWEMSLHSWNARWERETRPASVSLSIPPTWLFTKAVCCTFQSDDGFSSTELLGWPTSCRRCHAPLFLLGLETDVLSCWFFCWCLKLPRLECDWRELPLPAFPLHFSEVSFS